MYVKFQPRDDSAENEKLFIHRKHEGYSMFECHNHEDTYLGYNHADGSLVPIYVAKESLSYPDPRVLFVMHAKGSN